MKNRGSMGKEAVGEGYRLYEELKGDDQSKTGKK